MLFVRLLPVWVSIRSYLLRPAGIHSYSSRSARCQPAGAGEVIERLRRAPEEILAIVAHNLRNRSTSWWRRRNSSRRGTRPWSFKGRCGAHHAGTHQCRGQCPAEL